VWKDCFFLSEGMLMDFVVVVVVVAGVLGKQLLG